MMTYNTLVFILALLSAIVSVAYIVRHKDPDEIIPSETATAYVKKEQMAKNTWWSKKKAIILMTVSFAVMDGVVLYTVLDKAMLQNKYIGILMAFSMSLLLNMVAVFAARLVHQAIYGIKKHAAIMAVLAVSSFVILYGATCYLRVAYRDMYGQSSAVTLVNTLDSTGTTE
jgi:hypothetical protein